MRVVVDTNAVASALLFGASVPGRAFYRVLDHGTILASRSFVRELDDVLRRAKFNHYVTRDDRDRFLEALIRESELVDISETVKACRDPDGRRDGFHAQVNYHRLAGGDGEGRRTLDTLSDRHLGEWIARQRSDRDRGVNGADGRLTPAEDLQNQLAGVLTGEPPCDLFVRWKPLGEQPIGWEPDIDDGARINIRPFMLAELARGGRAGAGVLRARPKVTWNKDRGKEALAPQRRGKGPRRGQNGAENGASHEGERKQAGGLRPRENYPWFWRCPGDSSGPERTDFTGGPEFDGNRWNDLHYTNAAKRAARSRSLTEATP